MSEPPPGGVEAKGSSCSRGTVYLIPVTRGG